MSTSGQLSAVATVLEASSPAPHPVAVACYNADTANNQTVTLQLTPSGSSALTVCQIVLGPAETLILSGVYLAANDTVSGFATTAGKVNYFCQQLAVNWSGDMVLKVYDRTGRLKANNAAAPGIGTFANNYTATNDPGIGSDQNQGYGIGSVWVNVSTSRVWICTSALPGLATWVWANPALGAVSVTSGSLSGATFPQGSLTGGLLTRYVNTNASPGTLTTRTAPQMLADQPGAQSGTTYCLRIANASQNGLLTLAGGTGVTITGDNTIDPGTWNDFVVTFISSTTVTLTYVGSGSYNTDLVQGYSQARIQPKGL